MINSRKRLSLQTCEHKIFIDVKRNSCTILIAIFHDIILDIDFKLGHSKTSSCLVSEKKYR